MPMIPTSNASRCLNVLREGPATTAEVAAEIGLGTKITCAHLFNLLQHGKVEKRAFQPPQGRRCMLWSIKEAP